MTSVLDAVCCLLLVSAAAVTVTTVPPAPRPTGEQTRADAVANTLAATTTTVNYTLASDEDGIPDGASAAHERTTTGPLATLLARAAVRSVRLHGDPLAHTADDFADAVRSATLAALPVRSQVVVRWRPYPGAHVGRTLVVGPTPPAAKPVHAAVVRVPSEVPAVDRDRARRAAKHGGFDGLGDLLAARFVAGLFPAEQMRFALAGDEPVRGLVRTRYRRTADHYGVVLGGRLGADGVATANRRLAEGISEQVEADLRREFDAPAGVVGESDLGTVHVVVRTWSA